MSIESSRASSSDTQYVSTRSPTSSSSSGAPEASHMSALYRTVAKSASRMPPTSVNSLCGAMAGVASGIVTCPLDVIKTKLQAQGAFKVTSDGLPANPSSKRLYTGLVGTARVIWAQDGIRGMYRGLGPMLLGYLPTWAVYMSVYEGSRNYYYESVENKWVARIYASVTAGACSTIATNPIWVIKTRLQSQVSRRSNAPGTVQTPWYYRNTLDAMRTMYRSEGLRAFYSGLSPALLGLTHVAIQFPLYEFLKTQFTGLGMGESANDESVHHWVGIAAATFFSKVAATSATYPHEVVRTRLQTQQRHSSSYNHESKDRGFGFRLKSRSQGIVGGSSSDGMVSMPRYSGLVQTCRVILKEEGWRTFYNGMGTNMIRAIPAAMTTMLTFETLKSAMFHLREEGAALRAAERGQTYESS